MSAGKHRDIVIGIDGGGTYTRAMAADRTGRILAYTETGSCSPGKAANARDNVQEAIVAVIRSADRQPGDVVALVAGMAGLDSPDDQKWAAEFTALSGLDCPRLQVNDAVVAHAGALASEPGIIAISGTGSIVFGVTESGRYLRNYDFHHYAYSTARHLAYETVNRILAGKAVAADSRLIKSVLAFWKVDTVAELRALGVIGFIHDRFERNRRFGEMAPLVTEAALSGSPLARGICDTAAEGLASGILLLAGCFESDVVSVALIGGAVRSAYMQGAMERELGASEGKRCRIVAPRFSCAVGAVLMALKAAGIPIDDSVTETLRRASVPV